MRVRRWAKRVVVASGVAGVLGIVFVGWSRQAVVRAGEGRIFHEVEEVPECRVALVLGCSEYLAGGWKNRYFTYRMEAVKELWEAGKAEFILVSGDNSRVGYDEPSDMKAALVEAGIPAERIYCDYAGFRTLDSVVRAKEIFQVERMVVVSQEFHVQRALYLAREKGIEAHGYPAQDVEGEAGRKTLLREELARVKAVLDVKVLNTQPKFLGEVVVIGEAEG